MVKTKTVVVQNALCFDDKLKLAGTVFCGVTKLEWPNGKWQVAAYSRHNQITRETYRINQIGLSRGVGPIKSSGAQE